MWREKSAWYTLFAHAQTIPSIWSFTIRTYGAYETTLSKVAEGEAVMPTCTKISLSGARSYKVQYPSIKSLCSTIVERSFYGASVFAERRSRTVSVPFRLSSVPFRFHSVLLANQRDPCEVSVNASFGSEDDLQLLQMVAEGSRYESASFCVAARAYSDPESRLINYARTQQRAKQREILGLGHN